MTIIQTRKEVDANVSKELKTNHICGVIINDTGVGCCSEGRRKHINSLPIETDEMGCSSVSFCCFLGNFFPSCDRTLFFPPFSPFSENYGV